MCHFPMLKMIQVSNTMYTTVCLTEKKFFNQKYIKDQIKEGGNDECTILCVCQVA